MQFLKIISIAKKTHQRCAVYWCYKMLTVGSSILLVGNFPQALLHIYRSERSTCFKLRQHNTNYFFDFQRTPAPSSGLPRNSMPAFSNASLIASSVLNWAPGTPSADSSLCIEEKPTPDFSDKSDLVQSSIPLAARIWALVIKLKWSYNELLWTTFSL